MPVDGDGLPEPEDLVIFTAVPYDAYAYRIVASPNEEEVGELFTLNVPRKAEVHHLSREDYDARNGDASDIDAAVLPHTVGAPSSYPTRAERDALVASSDFLTRRSRNQTGSGFAGSC